MVTQRITAIQAIGTLTIGINWIGTIGVNNLVFLVESLEFRMYSKSYTSTAASRTGCSIAPATVARLMDCPNVVSFKAASGTTEEVTALRLACGPQLAIYSGDDGLTLPMLAVGAVGVVSVGSHVAGPEIRAMIEAYLNGDGASALALHDALIPLFKALFATTNPIPVKAALELNGWSVGAPRPPLCSLSDDMKRSLSNAMAALRQT